MSTEPAGRYVPEWSFGDRVRKIRRDLHLTQGEFAEAIERGAKAVAAWETGTNTPGDIVPIAKRIQMSFGVPATWTLGIEEHPHPAGPDGGDVVRPQGLEPRTRWFEASGRTVGVGGMNVLPFPEKIAS